MKQKLLNSIRLRAMMLVAVLCAAFAGQAWGQAVTLYSETFGTTGNKTNVSSYTGFSSDLITPTSDAWKISDSSTSTCNITGTSGSCNAYCGSASDLIFDFDDNFSDYTSVTLSFNYNKGSGNGKANSLKLYISADGGTSYGDDLLPSNTGATGWYSVTNISIPAAALSNLCIKFSTSTNTNRLDDIKITGVAAAPSYSITAVSNNESLGTVSLTGSTITGSPKSGCRYASPAYTVTSGTATVAQDGNYFVVTPSSDCTVRINFEAIPSHTATFSVNGNNSRTATVAEGASINFPEAVETTPGDGEFPKIINGKTFVGWYTSAYSDASVAPDYVNTATAKMGNANVTYYAVYADVAEEVSEDMEDAVKIQTLQYDTWTYSGSTTDKSSYRLFGNGSYIESEAFDLSKLIKVVVYGGTFGGGTYNSISIGDGTSTWKDVTVSGSSQTGENIYTGGTALSGTKALRVTSKSGDGSNNGVRISKVEIYVKGTTRTESNYTTDIRSDAGISFAEAEVSVKRTSGYTGQALTNPNSLTVAYSSSDETVATVNSSTGVITELKKAGTTTITATFAGDATYKPAEVSYELTVTEKTPCGLAYAVVEVEKLTTDAAFTNALTNGYSLTVAYSSNNTGVATVNASTGEVTIKGAGSTTITAAFGGDATYEEGEASYTLTVSKATPTLSFASDNATLRQGEDFEGNALTNPASLTVSYSSSNTSVATVNASSGEPSFVAAGSTTITASFTGNDTYTAGSASYTLKVLATPTIPVSDEVIAWGETFTVDDSGITGGTVSVTSGNTSIATVDGFEITPVACGEVEITVSTAENETYKAGNTTFTLTVSAPAGKTTAPSAETTYAFDFTNNTEWSFPEGSSNKTTESADYTADGKTITLGGGGSGNGHYFNTSDKYLLMGKEGATLTLPAFDKPVTQIDVVGRTGASGKVTQNIFVGDDAVSTETKGATTTNEYEIDSEYQAAGNIYTLKVTNDNNTQFTSIVVHLYQAPSTTVQLNTSGYGTFCSVNPMDFSDPKGYTAWRISSIEMDGTTGTVTCNKITEAIKGGQGVLLYNKNAGGEKTNVTVNFADGTREFTPSENLLIGTTAPTYAPTDTYFGLSGNNFVKVNAGVVPAGKALLPASEVAGVKSFIFVFNDDATGITETRTATREEVEAIFNLGGQRMSKMQRGVNIVNGKKVLVK